jgi:hypothetical protein
MLPSWAWAAVLVVIMLVCYGISGLKAIVYSDAISGGDYAEWLLDLPEGWREDLSSDG